MKDDKLINLIDKLSVLKVRKSNLLLEREKLTNEENLKKVREKLKEETKIRKNVQP